MNTETGTGTETKLYVLECTNVKGAILTKNEYMQLGRYGILTYQLIYAHAYDSKEEADYMCDAANQELSMHGMQFKVSTLSEILDTQKSMSIFNKEFNT